MKEYKITTLKMGTLLSSKGSLLRGISPEIELEIPIWAVAVEGENTKIIIDTGIESLRWVQENLCESKQEPDETMLGSLQKIGWTPDEVNIVINTHLHYDHCGNNKLFKNADFYVQKTEWLAAMNPIEHHKQYYYQELFDARSIDTSRLHLIEGEYLLREGICLIPTPGHCAGHQSVLINTKEGITAFSGDAANWLENVTLNVVPDILTNTAEAYTSLEEFRRKCEFIIPSHDPKIDKFQTSNFLKVHGEEKSIFN